MNNISLVNISLSCNVAHYEQIPSQAIKIDTLSQQNSPVFLIQSQLVDFDPVNQQLNISPFCEMKFVSSKPDVSIT